MSVDVGHISARLDAIFNESGFDAFDKRYDKAQVEAAKRVTAKLDAKFDSREVDAYTAALLRARAEAGRRDDFKAQLGGDFDATAFREFERTLASTRAKASRRITAQMGGDFDRKAIAAYNAALDKTEARAKRRDAFKAKLGADFDENAFRAAEKSIDDVSNAGSRLEGIFGGGGGGGGGISAGFGALRGALGPIAGAAAAAAPLLVLLAGAVTALAGSFAAAAAGAGAIGVGLVAALGPIGAVAGAFVQRFGVIQDAYKALGKQEIKSAAETQTTSDQQVAAAERVKSAKLALADAQRQAQRAQENLTDARRKAVRELTDLAMAADRSSIAEKRAGLSLQEALKQLAEVQADPKSTALDVRDAQIAVQEARQGLKQAHVERSRAQVDAARGTDTVKRAQQQLADAQRGVARATDQVSQAQAASASAATQQGSAATDAQAKLAKLSDAERGALTTFRSFVDSFRKTFQPATDAIFGGLDRAMGRLSPALERLKAPLTGIGKAITGVIDTASKSLAGPGWAHAFDTFAATAVRIVKPIGDSVSSVLTILRNIAVAAQPFVVELARGIRDALGGIADRTADAGRMRDIIRELVSHTRDWARFAGAVGKLLFTILNGGAKDGQSLVTSLTRIVNRWTAFLGTEEGQRKMRQFFHDSVRIAGELVTVLGKVGGAILEVSRFVGRADAKFSEWQDNAVIALDSIGLQVRHVWTAVFDFILGGFSSVLGGIAKGEDALSHIPGIGGKFKGLADDMRAAQKGIDGWRDSLHKADHESNELSMAKLRREHRDTGRSFRQLEKDGTESVKTIADTTAKNTGRIKKRMDEDSTAGKQALSDNFRQAAAAVKRQMDSGETSTKDGMKAIRGYLADELQLYGLSIRQARNIAKSGDPDNNRGREGGATRARGGWIGQPGAIGHDSIAMDAQVGGSILNRHQLPFADLALHAGGLGGIDGLLARGGRAGGPTARIVVAPGELHLDPSQTGALDRALQLTGGGGLDDLFSRVRTPHFLARGGNIVPVPGFPGELANRSILDEIAEIHHKYGLTLTDAYGPGHKSPGHTVTGTAADFAGPDKAMDAAVRALVREGYLVGYDGRFGSQAWPGHGPSYVAGANAHLHVELGTKGASMPGASTDVAMLPRVQIKGGGTVGRAAQRAVNLARAGAQRLVGAAGNTSGPDAPGSGGKPANSAQIRRWLAAGLRLAGQDVTPSALDTLQPRVMQESGGDPRAQNNWDSNAKAGHPSKGFLQTIDSTFNRWKVRGHNDIWNPVDNAAAAIRYMLGTYGHLVGASSSGYDKGGRIGPVRRAITSASRLTSRLTAPRVAEYDRITGDRGTVDTLNRRYSQTERLFNLSDEVLVDETTGAVNEDAIKKRAGELLNLAVIRGQVLEELQRARDIGRRVVKTYTTIIGRLTGALRHARTKTQRDQLAAAITANRSQRQDWNDKLYDLGFDIEDARLDRLELGKEYAEVTGTQPRPQDTSTTDTGSADAGTAAGDTTTSPTTADAVATPQQIAEGVAAALASFQSSRADVFAQFGSNFRTGYSDQQHAGEAEGPGVRAYGALGTAQEFEGGGGTLAGSGHTIINNFAAPPPDAHTWTREQEFELKAL